MDQMEIFYEDDDVIVCRKPAGLSSQRTDSGNDMITALAQPRQCEIYPVHRLDVQTSGLMVYAKNPRSASSLCAAVTDGRFVKEYLALVHGSPAEKEGVFTDLLFKDSKRNKSYVVDRPRKGVKRAELAYRVTESLSAEDGEYSLVAVTLKTGRTHQIRVQFASRKMPLAGDGKYGAADRIPTLGLISAATSFPHPSTGKSMRFTLDDAAPTLKSLIGTGDDDL